jgi:5-methyltetrahydropteroyltriglutamate--homocysteine methyltransferase
MTRPPFRADHVGSLLRSAPLKEAREQRTAGRISAEQLHVVEDDEIRKIIAKQQAIGLRLATDGEFRRAYWSLDFLEHLDGVEGYSPDQGTQFKGVITQSWSVRVVGKIGFSGHPMLDHFRFLQANTRGVAKMTIPAPTVLHFRAGSKAIDPSVYPDHDEYFADLAEAYRKAVHAFYDAGCRYLQLDDTVWAYLCSPAEREAARARGDDPEQLTRIYARMIRHAIGDRPADMAITTHVCRGNFRSSWISEGGYEPVAEVLLGTLPYDGFFLEYDTERAGGFEPLRFLPKGSQKVVLGLVTSKTGALEREDDIRRRIDEATKYVEVDQICLSPQCGFASTEEGNILTEDEQWAKLQMISEISQKLWPDA